MSDLAAPRTRTYQSGQWYGVVGPDVLVVLPPEERHRVAAIWALADGGAGFDETLDALIAAGLRDLHGFVLVSASEGDTKVVIRGAARAEFVAGGETVVVEGSAASTWVERSLRDVESMLIEVGEVADGAPSYEMDLGLVRVGRLTEAPAAVPGSSPGPEPDVAAAPVVVAAVAPVAEVPDEAEDDETFEETFEESSGEPPADEPVRVGLVAVPAGADLDPDPDDTDDTDESGSDDSGSDDSGSETDATEDAAAEAKPDGPADQDADVDPWIDPAGEPAPLAGPDGFESSFDLVPDDAVQEPEPSGDTPDAVPDAVPDAGAAAHDDAETGVVPLVDLGPTEAFDPDDIPEPDPAPVETGPDTEPDAGPDTEPDAGPDVEQGAEASGWTVDHDGATTFQPSEPLPPAEHLTDLGPGDAVYDQAQDQDDQPAPGDLYAVDHDGATSLQPFESDDYELARPGIAGQTQAPPLTSRPVARLTLSTGESVDVDRIIVLGRAPVARRYSPDEHPVLITVPSPHQEISSTHLEVRPGSGADHGTAVATDLGSTNGTVVAQPGLEPDELQPGISVQLIPGAVIDLGDGVSISVTRP